MPVGIWVERLRVETDVSELDEAWAAALAEAEQKARLAGRKDVAEYLSLRNSNDLLRKAYYSRRRSESSRFESRDLK